MTDERRPRPTDTSVWATIRKEPDEGAIGALWSGLSVRLDATPQKPRRIVDWPWSSGLPGVPRMWPRVPGPAVAALAIVALLAATMAIGVLVTAHRLPPPFGLARPGLIAFDAGGDVFVANADGTGRHAVTTGPADDVQPTWSHDGTMIAFWSLAPREMAATLSVIDADGSHARAVATKAVTVDVGGVRSLDTYDIAWSPDDRSLAFTGGTSFALRVEVAAADGTGSFVEGDPGFDSQTPAWSPDGTRIAFRGGRSDDDRGVYVMDADGSHMHRLTAPDEGDWGNTYSYFHPVWSPDGAHIAYTRVAGPSYADSSGWSPMRIWVVDADGSNARMVSLDQDDNDSPVWSPDGDRIAYIQLDSSNARIVVVTANGTDSIILPDSGDSMPHWSPDGTAIVSTVESGTGSGDDIVISSIDSGTTVRFPAPATDAQTELRGGDVTWQRLAP